MTDNSILEYNAFTMKSKTYQTVSDMLKDTTDDESFVDEFEELVASREIVNTLVAMRCKKGWSQQDLAEKMGCTQSRISKIESRDDSMLRVGDMCGYLNALGIKKLELFVVGGRLCFASADEDQEEFWGRWSAAIKGTEDISRGDQGGQVRDGLRDAFP